MTLERATQLHVGLVCILLVGTNDVHLILQHCQYCKIAIVYICVGYRLTEGSAVGGSNAVRRLK